MNRFTIVRNVLLILLFILLFACQKDDENPSIKLSVSPSAVTIDATTSHQFVALISGTDNMEVEWSIIEGASGGSISPTGLYVAPANTGTFEIQVISKANPAKKAFAKVTVTANPKREAVSNLYKDLYLASALSNVGWNGNTSTCDPGSTPQSTKDKVIMRITYYRKMVGLNTPISLNAVKSAKCQQTALMCKANSDLSHSPPSSWLCYTTEGKEAAGKSNLSLGSSGPNAIAAYMKDDGNNNSAVGHRRWLLFPKLKEVGTGDTNNTNALWVIGDNGPVPADMPDFIAWPPKGYVPSTVVYPRWSFSIPNADFSNTTINMKNPSGNDIAITKETLDNREFGDRTIVWKPQGIVLNATEDLVYKVWVNNVKVGTQFKNYQYDVIIFKP